MTSRRELPTPPDFEKAVRVLLKPPHVEYLKKIDAGAQEDPNYLLNHEFSVGTNVQKILSKEGIRWKPDVMKLHWPRVLRIALHKITENR